MWPLAVWPLEILSERSKSLFSSPVATTLEALLHDGWSFVYLIMATESVGVSYCVYSRSLSSSL